MIVMSRGYVTSLDHSSVSFTCHGGQVVMTSRDDLFRPIGGIRDTDGRALCSMLYSGMSNNNSQLAGWR